MQVEKEEVIVYGGGGIRGLGSEIKWGVKKNGKFNS